MGAFKPQKPKESKHTHTHSEREGGGGGGERRRDRGREGGERERQREGGREGGRERHRERKRERGGRGEERGRRRGHTPQERKATAACLSSLLPISPFSPCFCFPTISMIRSRPLRLAPLSVWLESPEEIASRNFRIAIPGTYGSETSEPRPGDESFLPSPGVCIGCSSFSSSLAISRARIAANCLWVPAE